mmetsp:Transcript_103031/g.204496  ORF Transcript_103031/g.204496 Transcript_103031/m.204496 type:complete len:482 (-) Transcript_103031:156-1601(-)
MAMVIAAPGPDPRRWSVNGIMDQTVLKMGIDRLLQRLAPDKGFSGFQLNTINGDSKDALIPSGVSSRSARFFERLLRNEMLLKEAAPGDVCAAQGDLRRLRTEQLLCIRGQTLDFMTDSTSHCTHNNFLEILDRHLFEQLARQHLDDQKKETQGSNRLLHKLGLSMVRVLGVELVLAEAANKKRQNPILGSLETAMGVDLGIPQFWILHAHGYDGRDTLAPQSTAVFFDSRSLRLRPLPDECSDWSGIVGNNCHFVAVYTDRSSGQGKERQLNWSILGLNPTEAEIRAELARARRAAAKFQQYRSKLNVKVLGRNRSLETVYESPDLHDHAADASHGEGGINGQPAVQSVASLVRMVEARRGCPVAHAAGSLPMFNGSTSPVSQDNSSPCLPDDLSPVSSPRLPPRLTRRPTPIITTRSKLEQLKRRRPMVAARSNSSSVRDSTRQRSNGLPMQTFVDAFSFWRRLEADLACCVRRDGVLV